MAAIGNRGTVVEAAAFNVEEDVTRLRGAMKGAGTDEAAVIEVLAHRTIAQRQSIKEAYKQTVGKDLADDLQGELTGNVEKVVLGLLMIAPMYDAYELRTAIKGSGTEEAALIDILASRTNAEIRAITEAYMKEHGKSLEDDIEADTSGMFKRVLVSLLTAGRDESNSVNETQAVQDAKVRIWTQRGGDLALSNSCLRSIRRSLGGTSRIALRGRCLALWRMFSWQ
uniref:Annexin n=1 Tax=Salmo trutta TaxID=8032 RepID=A0A674BRE3_SALTR